jgi:hypothetical protein
MNKYLTRLFTLIVSACALNSYAWDIYNNTTGDLTNNFSLGTTKAGDEITPAGSGWLNHLDIQYYGANFNGNEHVELWLYQNDGPSITLGNRTANAPGTLLWDSGLSPNGFLTATPRATLNYDAGSDFAPFNVWINGNFNLTLAVQFTGIDAGEDAGVTLYDFPSVGGNYNTYWTFNGTTWSLVSDSSAPKPDGGNVGYVDFGMRIDVVPEPTAFSLVVLGGLVFGLGRRFVRK